MQHVILGKRWRVKFRRLPDDTCGLCDHPRSPDKTISIDVRLRGVDRLDTILHESLHAALWPIDEEHITAAATDIAGLLWRLGYRRADDHATG